MLSRLATPNRRAWTLLAVAWLGGMAIAAAAAGEAARRDAQAELARQADAAAALHAAVLRSELEKHRSLPVVLAGDPDVARLLTEPDPAEVARINAKLEQLADQTRAAVIYVLNTEGLTYAASNWRLPTSFVGADYGFRPYFTGAMRGGAAEFFALGTVSGKPGLYLGRRVEGANGAPLGVVVVKVEFDDLEAEWRASGEPAYVVDPGGVVLITSVPEWRFRTTEALTPERRRLTLTDQTLEPESLRPLPFMTPTNGAARLLEAPVNGRAQRWMHAQTGTATPGWTLHLLAPGRGQIESATANARAVAVLGVTLIAALAVWLLRRRQQAAARAQAEERAREELERRIAERTRELGDANAARERLRDELAQTSKLAALGQIAAGVAHEINQPVAAIQTQAETAGVQVSRGDPTAAQAALGKIAGLTQRIGAITQELRAFSRKSEPSLGPVPIDEAVDGALLLLGGRLNQAGVTVQTTGERGQSVLADRFRLEQVIVNLVQNAVEALEGRADPRVALNIARVGDRVVMSIADNGPGVPAELRARLFTPFATTREKGLGLGLVICRDIVAEFGGELDLAESANGAVFVVSLRAA